MPDLLFISHPEVVADPGVPVPRWCLAASGIARMRAFAATPEAAAVTDVWASGETKAIEAAGVLAARLGRGIRVHGDLGENDRSATGYLPPGEFEATADAFFARPQESVRGWERAADALVRVRAAVREIAAAHDTPGDLAIVAHGGVGTLLLCDLLGHPISRSHDQPFQGHLWRASLPDLAVRHGWRPIAPRGQAERHWCPGEDSNFHDR